MKLQELKEAVNKANKADATALILNKVLEMVSRGDSKETIFEVVQYLRD